jgi:iron complex outermembrane receptor protein
MGTEKRNLRAIYIEDIWDFTENFRFTIGARYDDYSDFGDHVSPRIGLTWEYMEGYDLKLLYGHAFRAPTFLEYYFPSVRGGNPDLDPETIDTYEISLGADFTSSLDGRVTLFHRETEDTIVPSSPVAPWHYINQGANRDQGVEVEAKYDFGRGTYLGGNYTYINQKTGLEEKYYIGKIMANIRLSKYLNFYADGRFLHGLDGRAPDDPRDEWSGYEIINATLIAKKFLKGFEKLELRGSVYNLFDHDWESLQGPDVPDLPMPGINYLLEIKYKF